MAREGILTTGVLILMGLLGLGVSGAEARAASIQTCERANGDLFFTDTSCPAGSRLVKREVTPNRPEPSRSPAREEPSEGSSVSAIPAAAPPPDPNEALPPASQRIILRTQLGRAVSELATLKMHSLMHFSQFGDWPRTPEDLGLDPETLHTEDISAVSFLANGTIAAELRERFGTDKHLWLVPSETLGGASMGWQCRTDLSARVYGKALTSLCQPLETAAK